jgi:hypothetical protein
MVLPQPVSDSQPPLSVFQSMKTIRFPRPFRSYGAALVVSGLQFLSVFPNSVQAKEHQNLFGWTNLQSDIAGLLIALTRI